MFLKKILYKKISSINRVLRNLSTMKPNEDFGNNSNNNSQNDSLNEEPDSPAIESVIIEKSPIIIEDMPGTRAGVKSTNPLMYGAKSRDLKEFEDISNLNNSEAKKIIMATTTKAGHDTNSKQIIIETKSTTFKPQQTTSAQQSTLIDFKSSFNCWQAFFTNKFGSLG